MIFKGKTSAIITIITNSYIQAKNDTYIKTSQNHKTYK